MTERTPAFPNLRRMGLPARLGPAGFPPPSAAFDGQPIPRRPSGHVGHCGQWGGGAANRRARRTSGGGASGKTERPFPQLLCEASSTFRFRVVALQPPSSTFPHSDGRMTVIPSGFAGALFHSWERVPEAVVPWVSGKNYSLSDPTLVIATCAGSRVTAGGWGGLR